VQPVTRAADGKATRARVLDVGCGAGEITSEIARAGFDVVGIDVAEEPLRRARARDPQLDVRLVAAEGEWPLADSSFDAVWAGETLEHVLDTPAWLSQVRRGAALRRDARAQHARARPACTPRPGAVGATL